VVDRRKERETSEFQRRVDQEKMDDKLVTEGAAEPYKPPTGEKEPVRTLPPLE
jgi:hypothetical protein